MPLDRSFFFSIANVLRSVYIRFQFRLNILFITYRSNKSESPLTMKFATTFVTVLAVVLGSSQASAAYKFCPIYWQLFDGQCYRYFGDRATFATAQRSCRAYYTNSGRAELASVHSNDVNSFLYDLFRSSAGDTPDGVRISFIPGVTRYENVGWPS